MLIAVITLLVLPAWSQRNADYGLSAGFVTYIGDKNPLNVLYRPGPAAQFFYRYNLNPRQAVRANLLSGYVTPLSTVVGELGATYEYNFFPYSTFRSRRVDYTPYIAGGAALSAMTKAGPFFSVPFSAGFKINVANHVGVEIEYGFRKTFTDKLDGQSNIEGPQGEPVDSSWLHKNDWYSFMGVSVTWKMYNMLAGCPAYAEMVKEKKKKRR